jgi:2-oxoglutarate ferredoxin oxidoreductase subunit beta
MIRTFKEIPSIYCSGCYYNLINKIIADIIDELKIQENSIMVYSEGCSSFSKEYINIKSIHSKKGLAIPIAMGIKDVSPSKFVFTYQGEGDIFSYSIDTLINLANESYPITIITINNFIMAGNLGFVSSSTPNEISKNFYKINTNTINISNILKSVSKNNYIIRITVDSNENINMAKELLRQAFNFQIENKGFSFIEFLSICPTYWYKSPLDSRDFLRDKIIKKYPLGII